MTSAIRLQRFGSQNLEQERGYEAERAATRPSLARRRAAVLSYEQLVAGPGLLRRVARPVAVMPTPWPSPAPSPVIASAPTTPVAPTASLAPMPASSQASFGAPAPAPTFAAEVELASRISAAELARDPLAHPVAPMRPERAAKPAFKPVYELVTTESEPQRVEPAWVAAAAEPVREPQPELPVVEPVEPAAEPRHRGSLHGGNENPVRSMLSPSQRAALRRPETRLDRDRRTTYVTYTVDTTGTK